MRFVFSIRSGVQRHHARATVQIIPIQRPHQRQHQHPLIQTLHQGLRHRLRLKTLQQHQ